MRRRFVSVVVLILFAAFVGAIPLSPTAHASGSFVQGTGSASACVNTNPCTLLFVSSVTVGNLLVVIMKVNEGNGLPANCLAAPTVTDTVGSSFSLAVSNSCTQVSSWWQMFEYYATAHGSGADTVTVTFGADFSGCDGTPNCLTTMDIGEWSGVTNQLGNTGSTNAANTNNNPEQLASSVAFTQASALLVGGDMNSANQNLGIGANFQSAVGWTTNNAISMEYSLPGGSVTSPTFFPFVCAGGCNAGATWMIVGAEFELQQTVTVYVVGACNFFQLQCWAYPVMFMGMYVGFFMGVGMAYKVSSKGMMYLLLAGATFCSLIEVQLGIMTAALPILLIIANVAYSLRLDRLIMRAAK